MIVTMDIGGTHIKYGLIQTSYADFRNLGKIETAVDEPDFTILKRIDSVLEAVQSEGPITGVAISTAGVVDPLSGVIVAGNNNLPGFVGTPLRKLVERKYGIPCAVENDVNCALLGEMGFAKRNKRQNALMLTIGTGLGGALMLNGKIYHGSTFSAGEVGYSILHDTVAESLVSTTALLNNVSKQLNRPNIDGMWVFDQARKGNSICVAEINRLVEALVTLIINYVCLVNPEVVILGGGIMQEKEYLDPLVQQEFQRYSNRYVAEQTEIQFASLGNKAGMLGAFLHFRALHPVIL